MMAKKAACLSMREGSLLLSLEREMIARHMGSQLDVIVCPSKTLPDGRKRISLMRKVKAPIVPGWSLG